MLDFLITLFTEQLVLSADLWMIIWTVVVVLAFVISLVMGLVTGAFAKIKGNMSRAAQKPSTAVVQMKNMPAGVKSLYKTARISNTKPSALVTQQVCVDEPYKHSLVSKIWLVTLIATVICGALAYLTAPFAETETAALSTMAMYLSPTFVFIVGGILTLVGGIIGKVVYGGAVKTYAKFAPVIDGDSNAAGDQMAHAQAASQAQQAYAPQAEYGAESVQSAYAAEPAYEPQTEYAAEPVQDSFVAQPAYDEPVAVVANEPQESDEEIRRRAREEAIAQARAQQAQAQAQQQQVVTPKPQQQAAPSGSSTADDVIAQIEKISREGAPRETMRDVATLLQKERAKPENKTPEQQKRLNEALSKLLKAMSAATKK